MKGTNTVLKHSRVFVCWVVAGVCMGVYDNAIKYVSERRQFGQPISGNCFLICRIPTCSRENCQDYGKYPSHFINVL
jgi:hypothetical protein